MNQDKLSLLTSYVYKWRWSSLIISYLSVMYYSQWMIGNSFVSPIWKDFKFYPSYIACYFKSEPNELTYQFSIASLPPFSAISILFISIYTVFLALTPDQGFRIGSNRIYAMLLAFLKFFALSNFPNNWLLLKVSAKLNGRSSLKSSG